MHNLKNIVLVNCFKYSNVKIYCKNGCRHCAIKIEGSKLTSMHWVLFCWRETK